MLSESGLITRPITLTSWWARWRLKTMVSRLFTQPFAQAQIKENTKAPRHWPLSGNSPVTGEVPAQRASNAEFFFYLMTSSYNVFSLAGLLIDMIVKNM